MKMKEPERITEHVYLVGSSQLTDTRDCAVYLIDAGEELILIDSGAGVRTDQIVRNIELAGFDPEALSAVILTHCHIDHAGGAPYLKQRFKIRLIMHEIDATPVERADASRTAAKWYGLVMTPIVVDTKLTTKQETLVFHDVKLTCLHTPGHTPGSISVFTEDQGQKILFGQDIHGPFLPEFGADLEAWRRSMETLLSLNADVLCEGHFGVYAPGTQVKRYIERYIDEYFG